MFCQNCGSQLIDGARFCAGCGQAVEADAVPEVPAPEEAAAVEEAAVIEEAPVAAEAAIVPAAPVAPVAPVYAVPAAAPEKKSRGGKLALGIAGGIVGLAVLTVGGIFGGGHIMYNGGNYESARSCFELLGSDNMVNACDYAIAGELAEAGDYEGAWEMYDALKTYGDSEKLAAEARAARAEELYAEGEYEHAYDLCEQAQDDTDCEELMAKCHVGVAIEMYRAGEIEAAYDIFLEYSDETSRAYSTLCVYKTLENAGYADIATVQYLYGELEPYMDIEDVKTALEAPFFFIARLFDAEYEYRHYSLECSSETMVITHYLPFRTPGGDIWTYFDGDGFYFYKGEHLWFGITGFSSYDTLHPEEMYVLGVNETYTFTLVS